MIEHCKQQIGKLIKEQENTLPGHSCHAHERKVLFWKSVSGWQLVRKLIILINNTTYSM